MNYEIVCMDEKDTVSGNWTMKQVYDYCNSSYGCGGYGYDLKLPSGQGIAVLGYGGSNYKDRTLDEFVAFAEKDIQKVELKGNLLYDYGEIVDNFIENDSEYDQISALFEKDKGLYTNEEKDVYIQNIYERINSEEGFPVCFTLNERKLSNEEIFSKIDLDLICKKMFKTNFLTEGNVEDAKIFLLANYKSSTDNSNYKIENIAVVDENGKSDFLKIKDGVILSKDNLSIVPEEEIHSIVKDMTKAQISETSNKKITEFDSNETYDKNYMIKYSQFEINNIKETFKKLGIKMQFQENIDENIILTLSQKENGKTFVAAYILPHSSYSELRSDLYFCTRNMNLEEKDFIKNIEAFEKLFDKRVNFETKYRISGENMSKNEIKKEYYYNNTTSKKNEKIKTKTR